MAKPWMAATQCMKTWRCGEDNLPKSEGGRKVILVSSTGLSVSINWDVLTGTTLPVVVYRGSQKKKTPTVVWIENALMMSKVRMEWTVFVFGDHRKATATQSLVTTTKNIFCTQCHYQERNKVASGFRQQCSESSEIEWLCHPHSWIKRSCHPKRNLAIWAWMGYVHWAEFSVCKIPELLHGLKKKPHSRPHQHRGQSQTDEIGWPIPTRTRWDSLT